MNRNLGSQLASEHVKKGDTLWVKTYNMGRALVKILEDCGVDGWLVEVVDGELVSPIDPKKLRWRKGDPVSLKVASVDKWYQLAGGGEG